MTESPAPLLPVVPRERFRFCPRCGKELVERTVKQGDPPRLVCPGCQFVFYLNPKVAACAIFQVGGRIVLLKRGIEPSYGKWVFPGGFVNQGEDPRAAAVREVREEVNLDVRVRRLLNVYGYAAYPVLVIVYCAEVVGGELAARDETLEVRTFAVEEIPWSELAFPSTRDALREYMESRKV